ncbi:MAG: 50S ribosomal protein L25/general stress protein Ctc [Bacteroidia bacterium]|nr:MAG: 50S ribosomal protein L25/general stress protein Ctc [Bacteroidia bacterium]
MKSIEIKAEKRTELGKKATKELRRKGHVPCILYGQGEENIAFHAFKNEFRKLVYTPNSYIVSLEISGEKYDCVLQDIDFHPVTDEIMHIDFYRINMSKPFKILVPVKTKGLARGVQAGGVLRIMRRKLLVRALADYMPDDLVLDVTNLKIGESIRVNDLDGMFENLEFLDPQSIVVSIDVTRQAKSEGRAGVDEEGEEGAEGEEAAD